MHRHAVVMILRLAAIAILEMLLAAALRFGERGVFGFDPGDPAHWARLKQAWSAGLLVIDRADKIVLILSWPFFALVLLAAPFIAWPVTAGLAGWLSRASVPQPPAPQLSPVASTAGEGTVAGAGNPAASDRPADATTAAADEQARREHEEALAANVKMLAEWADLEAASLQPSDRRAPDAVPPAGHQTSTVATAAAAEQGERAAKPEPAGPQPDQPQSWSPPSARPPAGRDERQDPDADPLHQGLVAAVHARLLILGYREAQASSVTVSTEDGTETIDVVTAADGVVTCLVIWARPTMYEADEAAGVWRRQDNRGERPSPAQRARRLVIALQSTIEPLLPPGDIHTWRAAVVVAGGMLANAGTSQADWHNLGVDVCSLVPRPDLPSLESVLGSCLTPHPDVLGTCLRLYVDCQRR